MSVKMERTAVSLRVEEENHGDGRRAKTGKNGRSSQFPAPSDKDVCLMCKVRVLACLKWNMGQANVPLNLYSSVHCFFQ
jgi:hypothetical protein